MDNRTPLFLEIIANGIRQVYSLGPEDTHVYLAKALMRKQLQRQQMRHLGATCTLPPQNRVYM